jgi:hypothetical protein
VNAPPTSLGKHRNERIARATETTQPKIAQLFLIPPLRPPANCYDTTILNWRATVRKEIVLSGFWLVLSLYLVIESHRLGLSTGNRPGPGFFPFGAAAAIGILAGFRLVKNSRRRSAAEVSESAGNGETHLVLAVIAGMVVYVFLLDVLGFLLCTFLLVAF